MVLVIIPLIVTALYLISLGVSLLILAFKERLWNSLAVEKAYQR